jgi:hypothetical protein
MARLAKGRKMRLAGANRRREIVRTRRSNDLTPPCPLTTFREYVAMCFVRFGFMSMI